MTPRQDRRQHAVMASDAGWERTARAAGSVGMEISRLEVAVLGKSVGPFIEMAMGLSP